MKTHHLLAILLFLICANCTNREPTETGIQRDAIKGIWWSPKMFQSAAFEIKDSTIYYPDFFAEHRYDLVRDTLVIYQTDGVIRSAVIRATADTLILVTEGMEELYTRMETPVP